MEKMYKARRIFVVADFNHESLKSVFMDERRLLTGLIRCGQNVQRFSYRNVIMQAGLFSR